MDAYEATRVVYSRIQAMDPDNAAKIISLLLVQDHGDKEMIRLAFGPDALIHSLVAAARADLTAHAKPPSPLSIPPPSWPYTRGGAAAAAFSPRDDLAGDDNQLPCLYYARGFCKNGSNCRFLHAPPNEDPGAFEQDLLLRSRSPRLGAGPFSFSPTSPSARTMSFLLQQQQNSTQRAAAAAAAMMLGGDEGYKFMGRPRLENPGSRQIYLTFPADSTFREEDVSNYFSIYGPVQDVRIPYQQKRMFGFVTFLYPETVKLILAKGNPHFVCDARVLVKPYKEKGKVPDKYRKQQGDGLDFSACMSPTGLDRDPFELPHFGGRMMYNGSSGQELLLRRKLEEQKQAAELQQAIELQGRRFMGLQLMDVKTRTLPSPIGTRNSPNSVFSTPDQTSSPEDKSPSSDASAGSATANTFSQAADQLLSTSSGSSNGLLHRAVVDDTAGYNSGGFQESVEHNLPDNLFDMPAKAMNATSGGNGDPFSDSSEEDFLAAFGQPAALPFDIASFKPGFFPLHRFSSGHHGAVGM